VAAVLLIKGGWLTDAVGLALAVGVYFVQKFFHPDPDATVAVRGAD